MIYVDNFAYRKGRYIFYHLMSDEIDDTNLHEFASQLGMKREWFHDDHYDITQSKLSLALKLGAKPVSVFDMVKIRQSKR